MNAELIDLFGRKIEYLRISVTDRCNFRCAYCMPPDGVPWRSHADMLRFEEVLRVVEAAAALGVWKVRLTGGEPLVRKGIVDLVRAVAAVPGIRDVALTTNALLLERFAGDLAAAGLRRVNISLDTLRPDRFRRITRLGDFETTWRGILAAEAAGLVPIKLNTVVVRGVNDDEVADLASLSLDHPWSVRFIELMPIGNEGDWGPDLPRPGERFVPAAEIRGRVEQVGKLVAVDGAASHGPEQLYRLPGARGTVGFITPISHRFCNTCNRLRLTADGQLRPCLLEDGRSADTRQLLRAGASSQELQDLLRRVVRLKPRGHRIASHARGLDCQMSTIGG